MNRPRSPRAGRTRTRNPLSRLVARRVAGSDDRGATLLLALIFITTVSVVTAAILSLVDVSLRTTTVTRTQAAQAAAADGAAQIAINALRKGTFQYAAGSTAPCKLDSDDRLDLTNILTAPDGTAYNATVTCTVDQPDSSAPLKIDGSNTPANALVATTPYTYPCVGFRCPPPTPNETGIWMDGGNSHGAIDIDGKVYSNSDIDVDAMNTSGSTSSTVTARGDCGSWINGRSVNFLNQCGTVNQSDTNDRDPDYGQPTLPGTTKTVPNCPGGGGARVVDLDPGRYTDRNKLNTLSGGTTSCQNVVLHFKPGIYYFDLGGTWSIGTSRNGYVIGGTLAGDFSASSPKLPGSCLPPVPGNDPEDWVDPGPDAGVEFVLSDDTQLEVGNNGGMELCGTYHENSPPIALYGQKTNSNTCVNRTPYPNGSSTCAILRTTPNNTSGGNNYSSGKVIVQGTAYLPNGAVDLKVNNANQVLFEDGLIVRTLRLAAKTSTGSTPTVMLPSSSGGGPVRTVVDLTVYACPSTDPGRCGKVALSVRVGLTDASTHPTAGARQVTVYNWTNPR